MTKTFYKGYYLSPMPTCNEHGRYEAKIAVISMAPGATRAQRFLDLEDYSTPEDAVRRAIEAGKEWVDGAARLERGSFPTPSTDFAPLG